MSADRHLVRLTAEAIARGTFEVDDAMARIERLWQTQRRWMLPLARRLNARFGGSVRPWRAVVEQFLSCDSGFIRACRRTNVPPGGPPVAVTLMHTAPGPPRDWPVPELTTAAQLAHWLGLTHRELDWFADTRGLERKVGAERARRYRYRLLSKGKDRFRLIEAPKRRLKRVQRQLLDEILNHIPPHAAAHGFRPLRSIQSFVGPHVGRRVVLKMDLLDFFPSVPCSQTAAIYRTAGYPETVADLLTGLCTNVAPDDAWAARPGWSSCDVRRRWLYEQPHLPQGSPTSPALANLAAYRLDVRLSGLTRAAGGEYTRYADDLAFSGGDPFRRGVRRFRDHAEAIIMEEGFRVNFRKTRVMHQSQRQLLAGIVVNERPNIPRRKFERLKAILHNCRRDGPAAHNLDGRADFQAVLAGQIAFVASVHPQRGYRLWAVFNQIDWPRT